MSAVIRDGRLDLTGAGWHLHNPDFQVGAVGLVIEIPDDTEDGRHIVKLWMVRRVPQGEGSVDSEPIWALESDFTTRTTAPFAGLPKVGVKACPMPARKLDPHSRYTVRVAIDGEANEAWAQDFYTLED